MLAKKAKSQPNNASSIVFYETAYLHEVILYKNDPKYLQAVQDAEIQAEIEQKRKGTNTTKSLCSCIQYLYEKYRDKKITGYGLAKNIPIESIIPFLIGYVITYESEAGHIALYKLVEGQIQVIDEANYIKCGISSGRIIDFGIIKGFISF